MRFGLMTLAAGAVITIASMPMPAGAAGLVDAVRPDTNVIQAHYDHHDCQSQNGDWHRHRRNGNWRDCSPPSYSEPQYYDGPPPYAGPGPYYGSGPYYGPGPYGRRTGPSFQLYINPNGNGTSVLSDSRLKTAIVRLAPLDPGIGLYEYSFLGDERRRVGVLAQEIAEVMPDAVTTGAHGYYMVDYAAVFADPAMARALERSGHRLAP